MDNTNDIIKTGTLQKQGHIVKGWKVRHFVLYKNNTLSYYLNSQQSTPKGVINLINATVFVAPSIDRPNMFVLFTPDKEFLINPETIDDRDAWIVAIMSSSSVTISASPYKGFLCVEHDTGGVVAKDLPSMEYERKSLIMGQQTENEESGILLPTMLSASSLLTENFIQQIHLHLPARLKYYKWKLLYSTQKNEISLNTFYAKLKKQGPSIIIVEDAAKRVFGGFVTETWRVDPHHYGNGESFLFSLLPEIKFYHWTGKNLLFQYSCPTHITIGGGQHFGLYLDSDFIMGYSKRCETYNNAPLAIAEEFMVNIVEVWGFVDK